MTTQVPSFRPMTGDEAVAQAIKLVDPDVVAAYPITPQTIIVERFSDFWADGEVNTEYVSVDSEHSAMSACVGASATGARVFTASASQGIALMYEILHIAAGNRLPIVMAVANRALSSPINIHAELTDQMICRDTGWISWFGENAQEAYDESIMAFKVAENPKVMLPVMYGLDAFIVTHALERVDEVTKKQVQDYLGEREFDFSFRPGCDGAAALIVLQDYFMEAKVQQEMAMQNVPAVTKKAFQEFEEITGRHYDVIEPYYLEDAEYVFIAMGAFSGTAKAAALELRHAGHKVGVLKIRSYRPLPEELIASYLKDVKGAIVLDRSITYGTAGSMLYTDIAAILYKKKVYTTLSGRMLGLGGRDVSIKEYKELYEVLRKDVQNATGTTGFWGARM